MLTEYIAAALRQARYEILSDDGSYYGEIAELPGVLATADTLEACREELRAVLEGWIALGLAMHHHSISAIDGVTVTVQTPV